ncbi:Alpha/Beta hydrolase protein [Mycena vulgaris]|nr:Alpha/Beta hydrolase protein [Mycena vulgaris]
MGRDFAGFLSNIVKLFPSLAKRPLYLTGESYAGTYIPYITKTIFSTPNPRVNLAKMVVGDGTLGSAATFGEVPTITTIETYPQLIGYDPVVFNYFKTQYHLCGYDLNLTYPQNGHFPTLPSLSPSFGSIFPPARKALNSLKTLVAQNGRLSQGSGTTKREIERREERRQAWKRSLAGRPNGTLDPLYGCFISGELLDCALNFSFPWASPVGGADVYDIPDALNPEVPSDPRSEIHIECGTANGTNFNDPSPEPMVFIPDLATNATARRVKIVFYSGNDDSLVAHRGTEADQNMTFGVVQGFSRKPATPFTDDKGKFAGIIHQERNLTYALFKGAGHLVPNSVPEAAFVFVSEFVLGSNTTGLVSSSGTVVGGEDPALAVDVMPGFNVIYYGDGDSATTSLSTFVPSATLASWEQFIATATATALVPSSSSGNGTGNETTTTNPIGSVHLASSMIGVYVVAVLGISLIVL